MTLDLLRSDSSALNEILLTALIRSFTRDQVRLITAEDLEKKRLHKTPSALVAADLPDVLSDTIIRFLDGAGNKLLLLGRIPPRLARHLDLSPEPLPAAWHQLFVCPPAPSHGFSQSKAVIRYRDPAPVSGLSPPLQERACLRYDFMDEWNNLGFGAITCDGSPWSFSQCVSFPESQVLADLTAEGRSLSTYAALDHRRQASLLWFNRAAGPVDSQEWQLIEHYMASYGCPGEVSIPYIREIPEGYDAAVTMRLDCDEDISSARSLFDLYQSEKVPFSLALHTSLLTERVHQPFLREVIESGGSILSHSATHPVNWGGDYEHATHEIQNSRMAIRQYLGEATRCDYAVSPFHQNPHYAVSAMADAGLRGFIGGLIRNDPEYLLARGGEVPGGSPGFITHSQQCMLHGDCMLEGDDPLKIFRESFAGSVRGGALFGYLDHPFSTRYQYGWASEQQRLSMHASFLRHIKKAGKVLFLSENQALDWIRAKAAISLEPQESGGVSLPTGASGAFPWAFELVSGEGPGKQQRVVA